MLVNQNLVLDHDKKGTMHLFNTYNYAEEARAAMELAAETGETVKLSSGAEIRPMGFIPPDMWSFDPWLMEAQRAREAGDMHEFQKNMDKFFEIHPKFKTISNRKYF